MKQFNVVFGGAVSGAHKTAEVKKNLATLFKADEKKSDQLFAAPQTVLKRNVNYDQAMKYQNIDQQAASPPPIPQSAGAHMVGGKRQSAHKADPQARTHKKSNRGPFLIILGVGMILIRLVKIGPVGDFGFMDLLMGGAGVLWLITGIGMVTKQS